MSKEASRAPEDTYLPTSGIGDLRRHTDRLEVSSKAEVLKDLVLGVLGPSIHIAALAEHTAVKTEIKGREESNT